ncbi:MAG: ornithine carbamoyltransferase [bacterium]|nr:ornithine carbamoyltransferase [bacterium]
MANLLRITDLSTTELEQMVHLAESIKADLKSGGTNTSLSGKTLGMIFQKPSTRTRLSFEVGMAQMGGRALYIRDEEIGLGVRESIADVARVVSRYVDCIMIRAKKHNDIEDLAKHATVPVINGLSDQAHPCQALADVLTIREQCTSKAPKVVFVGDGNNVFVSLANACIMLGYDVVLAAPKGYQIEVPGAAFIENPQEAVKDADIIYTDVWTSMGQEDERDARLAAFHGYQVNESLMALAKPTAKFLHCLPAHRGEEVSNGVMEGAQSVVFDQAENRMHAQKAVLARLIGGI